MKLWEIWQDWAMSANFPDHWQLLALEESMEAIIDYRGKTPKKMEFGIPLITAKIVKGGRILPPSEFIAEEDYDSWMVRGRPEPGDVVITTEAPLGEVAQLTDPNIALAQRIVTLRGKKDLLNNDYLLCVMQSNYVQNQLDARASGSTVRGIKQSELRKVLLPIPPENEQIFIASHLLSLCKKVELNLQINQTLEEITQVIFKSWFVDFEPTRAKIAAIEKWKIKKPQTPENDPAKVAFIERAAICAISGKTEAELDQFDEDKIAQLKATAALFPDSLVDSDLGEIPEGWQPQKIENILELAYGKALNKTERTEGNVPVYGSGGLTGKHNLAIVDGPGIIVGRKGTVGSLYWEDKPFYPIDTVFYVKCLNNTTLVYAYYLLQTLGLEDMNTDAAVPGLNRNNVYRLEVPGIPKGLIQIFSTTAVSIRNLIREKNEEIALLEKIRDDLLPKLLSGEVSLSEAS